MELIKSKSKGKDSWDILKKSFLDFMGNRPVELGGTTAYFAIFSIAPIIIIVIAIFGFFAGDAIIRTKLFQELGTLIGPDSIGLLQGAIDNYRISENSGISSVIGLFFFLIFATTLFSTMQNSINYIWRVKVKADLKMNLLKLVKARLLSFGMILCIGFLLLVSLIIDAGIGLLQSLISSYFGSGVLILLWLADLVLTLGIITFVFALIFRFLPDVDVKWSSAWAGAFATSVLFTFGKLLIGIVVGNSNLGVVYGAAGSIIILLMWIYYASLIFYFGVQISYEYSQFYGHQNLPKKYAVPFRIAKE